MRVIVATDIYGRSAHVDTIARRLGACAGGARVVDPYSGERRSFADEQEAYACFAARCGHEEFARRVAREVADLDGDVFLVGFSAGAAAVWQAAGAPEGSPPRAAACFYGSRIRDTLALSPRCPVSLVFPAREEHFDVVALADALEGRPGVTCHRTPHLHGFMNALSPHFDADAREFWLCRLEQEIAQAGAAS